VDRRAQVDHFLLKCNQEEGLKEQLIRKHIWRGAGHKKPRQFQYWQAGSEKASNEDDRNFCRILAMKPAAFMALLKDKGHHFGEGLIFLTRHIPRAHAGLECRDERR